MRGKKKVLSQLAEVFKRIEREIWSERHFSLVLEQYA